MPSNKDDITNKLQQYDIYPTPQRVEIAQIMLAEPQHLSAEQILRQVNIAERAAVSKATVYNTLGLFAEKGLVRQVIIDPTRVFYDSNTTAHYHFFNMDTGQLSDIEGGSIDIDVGSLPDLPENTEVDGVVVIVRIRNRS
ncbi:MAG: Fur family transcriptional regulator [Gammaproteobacteria bacterium]|nr:MAG: Fur family transcriptional regulator [Gammaproteobacteria bacterium]